MSHRKKAKRRIQNKKDDDCILDWRIMAASRLATPLPAAYPGGPSHEVGTPVFLDAYALGPNGEEIGFVAPSPMALHMDLAIKGMRKTKRLRAMLVYENVPFYNGSLRAVAQRNIPLLFDMFEACIVTACSSYAALEAFCNYFLGVRLKVPYRLIRGEREIELPPLEVPRKATLEEKLGGILPDILKVPSPKGLQIWEEFKEIKKVRDAAIHVKAGDAIYGGEFLHAEKPLLSAFFQDNVTEFPDYALNMIEHFGPPQEGGQWFNRARNKLRDDDH